MIEKIVDFSARNKFFIIVAYLIIIGWGIWSVIHTPLDAIPDLSENQIIVFVEWMGRSPQLIEDQITFPLTTTFQGIPEVQAIRAQSMFGMSFIFIIFKENTDLYWARSRVQEKLSVVQPLLPEGVKVQLGPDGTGVGHIYWYTVEGKYDLGTLRTIQDWYIKQHLQSVRGVAEVASIGGYIKQYQIDIDPNKMRAYNLTIHEIKNAVIRSNNDVGGKILEISDAEYFVRGQGYIQSIRDIENIAVSTNSNGTPVYIKNLGVVQIGSDMRRGLLEKNGNGQVVGGIIVMRNGENAKDVIDRVKEKIKEISAGLPKDIEIKQAYDRTDLIMAAINNLKNTLFQEAAVVSIVVFLFLIHFRSVMRVIIEIPIAVLMAFILMRTFGITSNIMSLGGIAIAIGVIVDASIVLVENAYRNVAHAQKEKNTLTKEDYNEISIRSAKQVAPAIFFSVAIMVVSFLPVFLLEGQEGKLFRPLAFTKTFVMIGSAIIAITLVPMLMTIFTRGKFIVEEKHPISKILYKIYTPIIQWVLRNRKKTIAINIVALLITILIIHKIGSEFMPPLDEQSLLFMPVTLPSASITEVNRILQVQDAIIKSVPEVDLVLGKAGKAETSTDNAPVSMIETIIILKPKNQWRKGITKEDIIAELDSKLQIPGVRNGWTQPIINRINMLSTGVRTDLGIKIFGNNLDTLEQLAIKTENFLKNVHGAADLYAERVQEGLFLDIKIDRESVARYGLNIGDILDYIEIAIGGENLGLELENRARFPIRVRIARDFREDLESLKNLPIPIIENNYLNQSNKAKMVMNMSSPSNNINSPKTYIPLSQLAKIEIKPGPAMIASENSQLRTMVYLNVRDRDMGSFVNEAKNLLTEKLKLPPGYSLEWSGQWENQIRARNRLQLLMPIVLLTIFILLYFVTKDYIEALIVMLSVPFALIGGIYLIYILEYNFSVAVWIGFIALYGLAVETGVVMVVYLHEALDKRLLDYKNNKRGPVNVNDITEATIEGSVMRLRPKIMTVGTSLLALLPIMWSTGVGSDVMRPIAVPMIGGLITSAVHVLIVTPILFSYMKERALKKGKLTISNMAQWMK